nr:MAG TPA: hypothetical protein [Caudoviricetes sp.]
MTIIPQVTTIINSYFGQSKKTGFKIILKPV